MKIITENKVFHFLRNWKLLSASDVCMSDTIFEFYFPWFGNVFSLSVSVSLSLALSHMKPEVGRYVSDESNYNN